MMILESVLTWLRDPIWQSLGVLIAVFAAAWTAGRRDKKQIYYETFSSPVVVPDAGYGDRVKVLFDEKEVSNVWTGRFSIQNRGNIPVKSGDFEQNIVLTVGPESQFLSAAIGRVSEPTLNPNLEFVPGSSQLSIRPMLLNPGDRFEINFVSEGVRPTIKVMSRISGIKSIKPDPAFARDLFFNSILICSISLGMTFYIDRNPQMRDAVGGNGVLVLIASVTVIGIFLSKSSFSEWRRKERFDS